MCDRNDQRDSTDVASILFSFKAFLTVASGIVASEDFEDGLVLGFKVVIVVVL